MVASYKKFPKHFKIIYENNIWNKSRFNFHVVNAPKTDV